MKKAVAMKKKAMKVVKPKAKKPMKKAVAMKKKATKAVKKVAMKKRNQALVIGGSGIE